MILTIQDKDGWLAWDSWEMEIWGEGNTEDEAIAALKAKEGSQHA